MEFWRVLFLVLYRHRTGQSVTTLEWSVYRMAAPYCTLRFAGAVGTATAAEPFTIHDAIVHAVQSHPGVGEAAANRRATEAELRQNLNG